MELNYKALACTVLLQAIEDAKDKRSSRATIRSQAISFLRGDGAYGEILDLWCSVAEMPKKAIQTKMFRKQGGRHGK